MKFVLLAVLFVGISFSATAGNIESYTKKHWNVWYKNKPVARKSAKECAAADMEHFVQCVKKFAPHWLEEFAAIDKIFNWKPGTYLEIARNGIDYKTTPPPRECTSRVIMPELTGGKVMLHKKLDSRSRYLMAVRRAVPGKNSWTGIGNFGMPGVNSGISKDLAAGKIRANSGWINHIR